MRSSSVYHRPMTRLYFYELHEGATDLLTDALLVSEREQARTTLPCWSSGLAPRWSRLSKRTRWWRRSRRELERNRDFTYIGDEKLTASMSVGAEAEDTYLVDQSDDFRGMIVELDRSN